MILIKVGKSPSPLKKITKNPISPSEEKKELCKGENKMKLHCLLHYLQNKGNSLKVPNTEICQKLNL